MSSSSAPCKDCFTGELTSAIPTGIETTIHGLNTYVSSPPSTADGEKVAPKGIIVMLPDAFGWKMPNNRVLCDIYAKKGNHLVLLPDFMDGQSIPHTHLDLMAELTIPSSWPHTLLYKPFLIAKALYGTLPSMYSIRSAIVKPRIISFFTALRAETLSSSPSLSTKTHGLQIQGLKIGAAGFCWGGQYTIFLSQGEGDLIDCAFTAHPSFISIPGDIEKVKLPLSVCIGDTDLGISASGVKSLAGVLKGKEDCECVVLKDAKHGFALRSCVVDELQQGYSQVAEKQALEWFGKWLV